MDRYMAIDWCRDCKHDYWHKEWDIQYCKKCLHSYKPTEQPVGYEQEEQEGE